ncbi:MAG: phosphotransferase family protein [Cocleimonas sp.]|nr:phosphotransferase family protein [Cocleimonas sp.]
MIESILKTIPLLSTFASSEIQRQKLAGSTNDNYLITTQEQKYVLRIPRESTNTFINREDEAHNANIAHQLGIAPACFWREQDSKRKLTGVSLTAFIENGTPCTAEDLQKSSTLKSIAEALLSLHPYKNQKFKGVLNKQRITKLLESYYLLCDKSQQQTLASDYKKSQQTLDKISDEARPFVPSHIDLFPGNILLKENSLKAVLLSGVEAHPPTFTCPNVCLIDWEYSAMASPYWDIATVLNSANLNIANSDSAQKFLQTVFDKDCSDKDLEAVEQYQGVIKTFNHCWQTAFSK